jgi:hypothetical protein
METEQLVEIKEDITKNCCVYCWYGIHGESLIDETENVAVCKCDCPCH